MCLEIALEMLKKFNLNYLVDHDSMSLLKNEDRKFHEIIFIFTEFLKLLLWNNIFKFKIFFFNFSYYRNIVKKESNNII